MDTKKFELYWNDIPVGKNNAAPYSFFVSKWGRTERSVRQIMHDLSRYDNGDDYILIRSSRGKGFYRTDDPADLEAYRQECLSKGKSLFVSLKKINRVLKNDGEQYHIVNNLRLYREEKGMTQQAVCNVMELLDPAFSAPMLSKMENGQCLPTPLQLVLLSGIYGCKANELVNTDVFDFV